MSSSPYDPAPSSAPVTSSEIAEFAEWRKQRAVQVTRGPRPGWHGMRARSHKKYTKDDYQIWGVRLNGVGIIVDVVPGSPAWVAGIVDGTWILLIDGKSFDLFEKTPTPVGARVGVRAFRPDGGCLDVEIILADRPPPSRPRKVAPAAAMCGALVSKKERPKWLMQVTGCPGLLPVDKAVAARIATKYARENQQRAAYPPVARLAFDLGVSKRTVERALARLQHVGFVRVISGKRAGRANHYFITWPAPADTNVLLLRR